MKNPLFLLMVVSTLFMNLPSVRFAQGQNPKASQEPPAFSKLGLLPKKETGAARFMEANPEFDGRGVVVAIFDTGVDPGVAGLQVTTDGLPKIIDMIDGTGSGDVDTSVTLQSDAGVLQGLSGRSLKIHPEWVNPTGIFHLGIKRAWDLFPGPLIGRMKIDRRKLWNHEHHKTVQAVRKEFESWERSTASQTTDSIIQREEWLQRLEQLKLAEKSYEDPGPVFDCVVFNDGTHWWAVVDTDEDGDLTDEKRMTNFREQRQFNTFPGGSQLNFSVNIYDHGNRLSLVTDCGAHGTHVAGIVAGHFPDHPELNGIAPGAQIVSVKIGDTRLGSMETGAGLVRGLVAAQRNKCDLINMSFGEPTRVPDQGRLPDLFSRLVNRDGIIFVASAGNSGPALSTVGAPGGTTSAIIGVGAYVSPEMMTAEYALLEARNGLPYTWSSRGPTIDGSMGVDICAPGGAIAPVPHWTLSASMQMNGTSMSSPNACGNIALLLSGLKSNGIPYSPYSVRRAIQNTARVIKNADVFAQGPGLVQIDHAFDYLEQSAGTPGELLKFEVTLPGMETRRGIYLREETETLRSRRVGVRIRPVFSPESSPAEQIDFQIRLVLESSHEWVRCGKQLLLTSGAEFLPIQIDPQGLPPGVHVAQIQAYDATHTERGAVFRIPITVIRTQQTRETVAANKQPSGEGIHARGGPFSFQGTFYPGKIERRFLSVPPGATWADVSLRLVSTDGTVTEKSTKVPSHDQQGPRRFVLHAVQVLSGRSYRESQFREFFTLKPGPGRLRSFPVEEGRTLELCLAQYWSSPGLSRVEWKITFHGLIPDQRRVSLDGSGSGTRIRISTRLHRERLAPTATLTTHRRLVHPKQSSIHILPTQRDALNGEPPIYQLVVEYAFKQSRKGMITPRFPLLDGELYESPFGTQVWSLFDAAKRRIAFDDTWPNPVALNQGQYVLKLSLRHPEVGVLERYQNTPLALDQRLQQSIRLRIQSSRSQIRLARTSFQPRTLQRGEQVSLFVATPQAEQYPPGVALGDRLMGTINYGASVSSVLSAGQCPGGFPLEMTTVVKDRKVTVTESQESSSKRSSLEVRMQQLKGISFEKERSEFDLLAEKILQDHPGSIPLLSLRLHRLDNPLWRKKDLPSVVEAADAVIGEVNTDQLAIHFGRRLESRNAQALAYHRKQEALRKALIDALYRKGRALAYMELPDVVVQHPIPDVEAHDKKFEENFAQLARWVDTTDQQYVLLHVRRERRNGRYAMGLKWINHYLSSSPPNYWYVKKRRDLYRELGWTHCEQYENQWLLARFPKEHEAF